MDEAGICPGDNWVLVALENENLRSCQKFSKSSPDLQTFPRSGQLRHSPPDPVWPPLSHQPEPKMQGDEPHVKSNFRSGEEGTAREGAYTGHLFWGFEDSGMVGPRVGFPDPPYFQVILGS